MPQTVLTQIHSDKRIDAEEVAAAMKTLAEYMDSAQREGLLNWIKGAEFLAQTLKFAQDTTRNGGPDAPDTTKKAS